MNRNKNVRELSEYIDRLNVEKSPEKHGNLPGSVEQEKLFKAVRLVRSLREPALPGADYPQKLAGSIAGRLQGKQGKQNPAAIRPQALSDTSTTGRRLAGSRKRKRSWLVGTAAAAAAMIVLVALFNFILPFGKGGVVYAMEKAFQGVKAYHGTLEIVEINGEGKATAQAETEVWADREGRYFTRALEGSQKGLITVNNGQRKWQVQPEQKQVHVFPAFPDPYRFAFELGNEVNQVKNALECRVIGEETVSGRQTDLLEVTPKGGVPYRLWVDKETGLPLQKESGMQNALQYRATYTGMEFMDAIPAELTAYALPEGYTENNTKPEQIVANSDEAAETAGFAPKLPASVPEGYSQQSMAVETMTNTIKINYASGDKSKRIVILEGKPVNEFKPASTAVLGKVGSSVAEVQSPVQESPGILGGGGSPYAGVTGISSVRWQQDGMEFAVVGNDSLEVIAEFIKGISAGELEIAAQEGAAAAKPEVEVPYDLEVEGNDQKSADAGHSSWKLDPVFAAQVFVSLKISPEGITGDYPVSQEDLKVVQNTGSEAIVAVSGDATPVSRVYLKRLIRQDSTGIWTVVGYDSVKK